MDQCPIQAVHGNFSGKPQSQEVCVGRGTTLQLLYCDPTTGKIKIVCSHDVFGIIRSLLPFRLTGGAKDYIAVGSDSRRILILEFNAEKNCFERVHQATYGKSGVRRAIPGHYLAANPKGRAIMIGTPDRKKLVYQMNRDAEARLTISSPLEAHKQFAVCYGIAGIDVGFKNPMFACLEFDYEELDNDPTGEAVKTAQQTLTFYELDLGLNHVIRKYAEPLPEPGNLLIPVPGGNDGPAGVIVCCKGYLIYKNLGDQPDIRCPIPRRRNDLDDPDRSLMIICAATHKTKLMFFFLVQTEQGDLFKVTLETEEDLVTEMKVKYFDTVPPANAMCILKTGFLFASEFRDHQLYQIANLGEDDEEAAFSSKMPLGQGETFFYGIRELRSLVPVDNIKSLCPPLGAYIGDMTREVAPGLQNGLEVVEMAVSELPGNPNAVWTVRRNIDDAHDSYIVVSFVNTTLVLTIGETVEEAADSGFLATASTLGCGLLGEDTLQIYADGIRHIRSDRRVNVWKTPGKRQIVKCTMNRRQVAIALSGAGHAAAEIVYFELDQAGQLNEFTERKVFRDAEITCMSLSEIPEGEIRSRFLAIGASDNTVRIISLDHNDTLSPLSMRSLSSQPESLLLVETSNDEKKGAATIIGLQNGCLLRTTVDNITGIMLDTRTRYLGTRPVKLFRVRSQNKDAVLCTSSRTWLLYHYQNRFHLTPLSYKSLEFAAGFCSDQCAEGIVAIAENTLHIIQLSLPKYTPPNRVHDDPAAPSCSARRFSLDEALREAELAEDQHLPGPQPIRQQNDAIVVEIDVDEEDGGENGAVVADGEGCTDCIRKLLMRIPSVSRCCLLELFSWIGLFSSMIGVCLFQWKGVISFLVFSFVLMLIYAWSSLSKRFCPVEEHVIQQRPPGQGGNVADADVTNENSIAKRVSVILGAILCLGALLIYGLLQLFRLF